MTRSIFDPDGGETEHSGSRNSGPSADNLSHMPPDIAEGVLSDEDAADNQAVLSPEEMAALKAAKKLANEP